MEYKLYVMNAEAGRITEWMLSTTVKPAVFTIISRVLQSL